MLKEKISKEVKNSIMPELEKIMFAANETAKESQKIFLENVTLKLELWEKEILKRVEEKVCGVLEKNGFIETA